jgi:hypothetical protein
LYFSTSPEAQPIVQLAQEALHLTGKFAEATEARAIGKE